jgi:hypothetical protein|tara:strand:+ start:461 stop:622 length:162 start_codon:yes stop_codon:yes gene_type:complete
MNNIDLFFENFEESVLVEMALKNPHVLSRMCTLVSLDLQLIKECYYEKNVFLV